MTPLFVQDSFRTSSRISDEDFVFLVCQQGAEATIKQDLLEGQNVFRLAFSRPGLLTFKVVRDDSPQKIPVPRHPLVRQSGWVLGQVRGESAQDLANEALKIAHSKWDAVHLFQRDPALPGDKGYEPGSSALCDEIGQILLQDWGGSVPLNRICQPGNRILDIILVAPNHWIIGHHEATHQDPLSCWPGGVYSVPSPPGMISRAYLKMAESIMWSGLPIASGDSIVEIGCAPGGAAQRLLDMGLKVTGVDPAEVDPVLLEHPNFTFWRGKAAAIKRKKYQHFRWLAADANVAPNYTLDFVEDIVTYPTSRLAGILLTLKLTDYALIQQLPKYMDRVAGWGLERVDARQLAHNRRELFLVGQRTSPL